MSCESRLRLRSSVPSAGRWSYPCSVTSPGVGRLEGDDHPAIGLAAAGLAHQAPNVLPRLYPSTRRRRLAFTPSRSPFQIPDGHREFLETRSLISSTSCPARPVSVFRSSTRIVGSAVSAIGAIDYFHGHGRLSRPCAAAAASSSSASNGPLPVPARSNRCAASPNHDGSVCRHFSSFSGSASSRSLPRVSEVGLQAPGCSAGAVAILLTAGRGVRAGVVGDACADVAGLCGLEQAARVHDFDPVRRAAA